MDYVMHVKQCSIMSSNGCQWVQDIFQFLSSRRPKEMYVVHAKKKAGEFLELLPPGK